VTNVIKLKFMRNGQPSGREYAYCSPVTVEIGDIVELDSRNGITKGIVTAVNVPESDVSAFKDQMKSIHGKLPTMSLM